MSLRPQIYGFCLKDVQSIFASNDEAVLQKIYNIYEKILGELLFDEPDETKELKKQGREIIRRAVMQGVPFEDLKCEREVHTFAAEAVVRSIEIKPVGDTNDWSMQAFWDLRAEYGTKVSRDALNLFDIFYDGRPFFGKKIDSGWSYYGHLTLEEVNRLSTALDSLGDSGVPDDLKVFVAELTDWLEGIASANLDLWFVAS